MMAVMSVGRLTIHQDSWNVGPIMVPYRRRGIVIDQGLIA